MGVGPVISAMDARVVFSRKVQQLGSGKYWNTGFKVVGKGNAACGYAGESLAILVDKRMISPVALMRGIAEGQFPRRMAAQPASRDKVKCETQTPCLGEGPGAVRSCILRFGNEFPIWTRIAL